VNPYRISHSQLAHLLAMEPHIEYNTDDTGSMLFMRIMDLAKQPEWSKSFSEEQFSAGEAVFLEGEWGDCMYSILSGRVAIIKGDLDSPTILAFRSEGEIIGEMALLENQPRSATVIALDRLYLLSINRRKFQDLLHKIPSVSLSIMEMLSSRLRKTDEALTFGDQSEKHLIHQVSILEDEKLRLEELRRLQQETSELIIHDLRNPLSNIAVSLKMLSKTIPPDILQANSKILEIAQNSCDRLQRLVDSLLEVSRIESGESQFFITEVNFNNLLQETIEQFSALERKNIQLELDVDPDLPLIPADRDKIERVLINLLDNAFKYSPSTGIVKIEARMIGDHLNISITDQGAGIPSEDRERIFERFTQVSGESRKRRGFGLGLAYCRLAIEGHSGKIWVETGEEGSGSCFIFTLPTFPAPVE
jgi:signal transduction histidine kinase